MLSVALVSSANTILKFLEEPAPNIVAILLTKNIYQVLETIVSRCQIISLAKHKEENLKDAYEKIKYYLNIPESITEETFNDFINYVVSFIISIESKGYDTILYTQKLWHDIVDGKELNIFAFEIIILYYKDVLNYLNLDASSARKMMNYEEIIRLYIDEVMKKFDTAIRSR